MPADMQGAPELTLPEPNKGVFTRTCPPEVNETDDQDLDRDPEVTADLVIENARVLTMDPARPRAEAVAVRGDRITRASAPRRRSRKPGPPPASSMPPVPPCCPASSSRTCTSSRAARALTSLQLDGVHGLERAGRRGVRAWATTHPDDRIIYGVRPPTRSWPSPTRHHLDQVLPDRPSRAARLRRPYRLGQHQGARGRGPAARQDAAARQRDRHGRRRPRHRRAARARAYAPLMALLPSGGREKLGITTGRDPVPPPSPESGPPTAPPSAAAWNGARGTASPRSTTWTATPTSSSCCASWTMPASWPAGSACRST